MEEKVDEILISPGKAFVILFEQLGSLLHPTNLSHSCQIHQHDTSIQACQKVMKSLLVSTYSSDWNPQLMQSLSANPNVLVKITGNCNNHNTATRCSPVVP